MKPGFHQDATVFGYVGVVVTGPPARPGRFRRFRQFLFPGVSLALDFVGELNCVRALCPCL